MAGEEPVTRDDAIFAALARGETVAITRFAVSTPTIALLAFSSAPPRFACEDSGGLRPVARLVPRWVCGGYGASPGPREELAVITNSFGSGANRDRGDRMNGSEMVIRMAGEEPVTRDDAIFAALARGETVAITTEWVRFSRYGPSSTGPDTLSGLPAK